MAKAYKCDRCGKFYILEDPDSYDEGITEEPEIRLVKTNPKNNAYYKNVDVCERCHNDLKDWFEACRKKEEEVKRNPYYYYNDGTGDRMGG